MPDGETHLKIWKKFRIPAYVMAVGAGVAYHTVTGSLDQSVIFAGSGVLGYSLGYFFSPDLDLVGITSDEGRLMRELKIIGVIITAWFLPYAYLMRFVGIGRKGHRNFFSHFPFISTFIRLIWLLAPFAVLGWYMKITPQEWWWVALAGVFLFLGFADTLHFLADTFEGQRRTLWKRILL